MESAIHCSIAPANATEEQILASRFGGAFLYESLAWRLLEYQRKLRLSADVREAVRQELGVSPEERLQSVLLLRGWVFRSLGDIDGESCGAHLEQDSGSSASTEPGTPGVVSSQSTSDAQRSKKPNVVLADFPKTASSLFRNPPLDHPQSGPSTRANFGFWTQNIEDLRTRFPEVKYWCMLLHKRYWLSPCVGEATRDILDDLTESDPSFGGADESHDKYFNEALNRKTWRHMLIDGKYPLYRNERHVFAHDYWLRGDGRTDLAPLPLYATDEALAAIAQYQKKHSRNPLFVSGFREVDISSTSAEVRNHEDENMIEEDADSKMSTPRESKHDSKSHYRFVNSDEPSFAHSGCDPASKRRKAENTSPQAGKIDESEDPAARSKVTTRKALEIVRGVILPSRWNTDTHRYIELTTQTCDSLAGLQHYLGNLICFPDRFGHSDAEADAISIIEKHADEILDRSDELAIEAKSYLFMPPEPVAPLDLDSHREKRTQEKHTENSAVHQTRINMKSLVHELFERQRRLPKKKNKPQPAAAEQTASKPAAADVSNSMNLAAASASEPEEQMSKTATEEVNNRKQAQAEPNAGTGNDANAPLSEWRCLAEAITYMFATSEYTNDMLAEELLLYLLVGITDYSPPGNMGGNPHIKIEISYLVLDGYARWIQTRTRHTEWSEFMAESEFPKPWNVAAYDVQNNTSSRSSVGILAHDSRPYFWFDKFHALVENSLHAAYSSMHAQYKYLFDFKNTVSVETIVKPGMPDADRVRWQEILQNAHRTATEESGNFEKIAHEDATCIQTHRMEREDAGPVATLKVMTKAVRVLKSVLLKTEFETHVEEKIECIFCNFFSTVSSANEPEIITSQDPVSPTRGINAARLSQLNRSWKILSDHLLQLIRAVSALADFACIYSAYNSISFVEPDAQDKCAEKDQSVCSMQPTHADSAAAGKINAPTIPKNCRAEVKNDVVGVLEFLELFKQAASSENKQNLSRAKDFTNRLLASSKIDSLAGLSTKNSGESKRSAKLKRKQQQANDGVLDPSTTVDNEGSITNNYNMQICILPPSVPVEMGVGCGFGQRDFASEVQRFLDKIEFEMSHVSQRPLLPLAIDSEWHNRHKHGNVALVQVALPESVWLFDFCDPKQALLFHDEILRYIGIRFAFIGFGLKGDVERILDTYRVFLKEDKFDSPDEMNEESRRAEIEETLMRIEAFYGKTPAKHVALSSPLIELRSLAKSWLVARRQISSDVQMSQAARSQDASSRVHVPGLAKCVRDTFLRFLDKREQCSNWEHRPLSRQQIHYAALDAWILLPLWVLYSSPVDSSCVTAEDDAQEMQSRSALLEDVEILSARMKDVLERTK